ncbi:MAG: hypothetical protein MR303_12485 [Emergencia sp.]|nr:hypothetical protein [Emergencia sp.]
MNRELRLGVRDTTEIEAELGTCYDIFGGDEDFENRSAEAEEIARTVLVDMAGLGIKGSHFILYDDWQNPEALETILRVCSRYGINLTLMRRDKDGTWQPEEKTFWG